MKAPSGPAPHAALCGTYLCICLLFACHSVVTADDQTDDGAFCTGPVLLQVDAKRPSRTPYVPLTILETAKANGNFKLLIAALDAAGLADTFDSNSGEFTVFAPTDGAIKTLLATLGVGAPALLARKDLAEILTFHVAPGGVYPRSSLADGMLLQTLQGAQLLVKIVAGTVKIGGAGVAAADIRCSNGVIHAIDSVLLPPRRLALAGGENAWDPSEWRVQVDGVMGGRSSGAMTVSDKMMIFSGSIKLDGGGFSSVRHDQSLDLSSYGGLWVETGTTTYAPGKCALAIHVQLEDRAGTRVAAPVALPIAMSQERHHVFVPMSHFTPRSTSGSPSSGKLDVANVRSLGISVLFQEGPFEVRLHEISAVKHAADAPASPTMPGVPALAWPNGMTGLLAATIKSGVFVYNQQYQDLCAAIYASTTRSILATPGLTAAARGVACAGLTKVATLGSDFDAQAWILRRAFDAILADVAGVARNSDRMYPKFVQGDWLPASGAPSQNAATACASMLIGDIAAASNSLPVPAVGTPMEATLDDFEKRQDSSAPNISSHVSKDVPCPAEGRNCTLLVTLDKRNSSSEIYEPYIHIATIIPLDASSQVVLEFGKHQPGLCCAAHKLLQSTPGVKAVESDAQVAAASGSGPSRGEYRSSARHSVHVLPRAAYDSNNKQEQQQQATHTCVWLALLCIMAVWLAVAVGWHTCVWVGS